MKNGGTMGRQSKGMFVGALVALLAFLPVASYAFAATSQDVTVTATPAYIELTNSPSTWTLNGITGDSVIEPDTVYYANPLGDTTVPSGTVVDGECNFTATNTANSTVSVDLDVDCGNFTGGDANMTNSGTGANGATSYGAYSWNSGDTYPAGRTIMKSSASAEFYTGLATNTAIKWGCEIETQADAWAGGSSSTTTMTVTATKS